MAFTLKGSIVAIVTPFLESGEIDWDAFDKIIDFHLTNNTDGIVVCGTTGETPTLSDEEDEALVARAVELIKGKIPVIAGSGSNCTLTAIEKTQKAKDLGADAALVVVPYYNKPTQKGIYNHFKAVAEAVDIPIILYNVPSRTGAGLEPETVVQLANDFDNIVAVKEAAGVMSYFTEILANAPEDFLVYSGDDFLACSANLLGAHGCISVVANIIPKDFSKLMEASQNGDVKITRELFYKYQKLMDLCFIESNPIPVKTALAEMGMMQETFRAPLCTMVDDNKQKLMDELKALSII
ncbi:4-hydroxy-tetrahydrodipicolinate synthase [Plebeiibacterium sediminum]|uniref:4-hydroxy-tetrahydrodipicolinate synthase n=1 Tax=Plebeiibacterium sediminum TaxID=2992112 RepID=A0AAE3M946_9BACT|nr:4-hydroxy-tetrahydrodipicolinate synthase [Plebeiobacterium sediminum]MCW3789509.1 4-hydroxy-tetrahydrodipicolinate synthase [Plebeiobacterium sediminum]